MREIKFKYRIEGKNREIISRIYTLEEIEKGILSDHFKNKRIIYSRKLINSSYSEDKSELLGRQEIRWRNNKPVCVNDGDKIKIKMDTSKKYAYAKKIKLRDSNLTTKH